jgi:hypothetical protein
VSRTAESPRTPTAELQRIDFSGTIWFGSTLVAASLTLAGLLAAGWRPSQLAGDAAPAFWIGGILAVLGIAVLAYAGCPVIGPSLTFDDRTKSIAIRAGLAAFGVGGVAVLLAVLLSPA